MIPVQLMFSDFLPPFSPPAKVGEYVKTYGRIIRSSEIAAYVGKTVICNKSTESHEWYRRVKILSVHPDENGRRVIFNEGSRQNSSILDIYLDDTGSRIQSFIFAEEA